MRRRLRRRPAPRKALTPKSTIWKAPGSDDSGDLRLLLLPRGMRGAQFGLRLERWVSSSFLQGLGGWVRYTLPPLLQGHPPHPDAPLFLASLRRAPGWAP